MMRKPLRLQSKIVTKFVSLEGEGVIVQENLQLPIPDELQARINAGETIRFIADEHGVFVEVVDADS